VLQTDEFLNATPYNPAFAETMTFVKDFWNNTVYDPLLRSANVHLSTFVIEGTGTSEEALNALAEEHDQILREAGYIK
jgi:multiple sugar transport system substrate-binding protein